MVEEIKQLYRDIIADPEFVRLQAEALYRQFEALTNLGFTKEEAIALLGKK